MHCRVTGGRAWKFDGRRTQTDRRMNSLQWPRGDLRRHGMRDVAIEHRMLAIVRLRPVACPLYGRQQKNMPNNVRASKIFFLT